jgi:hypothetical protein
MKEFETVKNYYSIVKEIINQMRVVGKNIHDKNFFKKILITMPPKFDSIVTTIEEIKDLSTLSVTKLVGSFEAYGQILHRHKEYTLENSLQSNLVFESQNKENRGKKSYGETSRRREVSRNLLKNKSDKNTSCNICKRLGHAEENCWYRKMQNMPRLHLHAAIVFDKLPHAIN